MSLVMHVQPTKQVVCLSAYLGFIVFSRDRAKVLVRRVFFWGFVVVVVVASALF